MGDGIVMLDDLKLSIKLQKDEASTRTNSRF